jgi:hypothetical protein
MVLGVSASPPGRSEVASVDRIRGRRPTTYGSDNYFLTENHLLTQNYFLTENYFLRADRLLKENHLLRQIDTVVACSSN